MDKMDGKTMDIVAENVGKLKELFPEAFTEGKVDFEALKEVLGTFVDDRDERYSFSWNGKNKARMIAQTPSTGTLRPCKEESVDWDSTQNIFIEGDNLEVLKLLQKSYHKKVKMIYIDPPYNTGKDFVYKDNFKDNIKNYKEITGQVDGEGRNLSNNPETSGRYHTDWLNMMYPRLKLARNLLKDEGVIFISIDDNEVSNLRKMCDEIFGEENFIAELIWKKRSTPPNDRVIAAQHEYILCFVKDNRHKSLNLRPRTEKQIGRYKNPDKHPKGPWTAGDLMANVKGGRYVDSLYYPIVNPRTGKEHYPSSNGNWRFNKERIELLIKNNEIYFGENDNGRPKLKRFLCDVKEGITWTTLWDFVPFNTAGSSEMTVIFGNLTTFENPKPTGLILDTLRAGSDKDSIILDFFAGSATTAHATMQLNAMDNGDRKCITVQLPESCDEKSEAFKSGYKTIAEISKERIRRAGKQLKMDNGKLTRKDKEQSQDLFYEKNNSQLSTVHSKLDIGFKVFKLDSTNIKPWEVDFDLTERTLEDFISNIKADRREEDILYEILLKYGLALNLPIEKFRMDNGEWRICEDENSETLNSQLSTVNSQLVYSIGMGALIICLSDAISLDVVEGIAKLKEELNPEIMRVVFKDSGFADDVVKTNAVQILRTAGIVDVRSI